MKQISWLSGLSATRRPASRASSRIAGFSKPPTGKMIAIEQVPGDPEQHVRLVLGDVVPADEGGPVFAGDGSQLGIVTRGDGVGIDLLGEFPQLAELEPVVAHHAGIGRAAGQVFVGEVVLDPAKRVLKVEGVKRNIEQVGHAAGVGRVGRAAAALLVGGAAAKRGVVSALGNGPEMIGNAGTGRANRLLRSPPTA